MNGNIPDVIAVGACYGCGFSGQCPNPQIWGQCNHPHIDGGKNTIETQKQAVKGVLKECPLRKQVSILYYDPDANYDYMDGG